MRKGENKRKECFLVYADDVVLMAKREKEIKSMMEKLEGYLDRKRLVLNVGKTKVIRFRKVANRKKAKWR